MQISQNIFTLEPGGKMLRPGEYLLPLGIKGYREAVNKFV
jgi:hypothetical protein